MYRIIGILLLLVFYSCYFIKVYLQSRKGIRTDHIGENKEGIAKFIEISMKITTIITPIIEVISILLNLNSLPESVRLFGILLGVLGDLIFITSVITMKDSWRAGVSVNEETKLVTNGIYSWSRNPAFLGFDLVYISVLLIFFNWILMIFTLLAMILFHLQIVYVEESFLISVFKDDYVEYCKYTNRYLGKKR